MTSDYKKRESIVRALDQIDRSWRKQYERYLDFSGREPRPIDKKSFIVISAFFLLSWGLSTWQGLLHLVPAISITTVVSFASLRCVNFNRAYRQYFQERAGIAANFSDGKPA